MTFKEKYNSIDQTKLPETAKAYMVDFKKDSNNFTNKEAMAKMMPALDKFIAALKDSGYGEAIKGAAKKETKKKAETPTEMAKEIVEDAIEQPKTKTGKPKVGNISKGDFMKIAKEIRKEGESWNDAMKRAGEIIRKQKEGVKTQAVRQYEKLKKFIAKHPEVYREDIPVRGGGFRKTTINRDAPRVALPKGKRVSKAGWKNQYGKSDGGKTYYEYRSNRYDTRRQRYPFLAKGGEVDAIFGDGGMTKRIIALPVGTKEQIEESIRMGFDTLVEGMISPKTRGVMLIDKDSNVRGAYPMIYKGAIEEVLHNIKGYAKGGVVGQYRIIPYKRIEIAGSPDLIEPYYSLGFTLSGSLEEANAEAQEFVKTNSPEIVSATVTKIHPSGQPLKNKKVSYVTKDEITKYEHGGELFGAGRFAKGGSISKSTTYVPNRDVKELMVVLKGELTKLKGKDILDGVYVKNKRKPSPSTESPKELLAFAKKKASSDTNGGKVAFDESDIQLLLDAGLSAQDVKNVLIGYTAPSVKADTEFGKKTYGIINYSDDVQKNFIAEIANNAKSGYFEIGLKYPSDFNWKPIIEKFGISTTPKVVETTGRKMNQKFEVFLGKGVAIGNAFAYKFDRDKKWSESGRYEKLDSKNPEFKNGYWGIVTKSVEDMYFIVDTLLKQSGGYLKDLDMFRNGLGGVDIEAVENLKFAKGGEVDVIKIKDFFIVTEFSREKAKLHPYYVTNREGVTKYRAKSKADAKSWIEEQYDESQFAKGGIYSSDDRWKVTFQNQDTAEFETIVVRANNKKNAIVIAEDESGLGSEWQYYSAEQEMAKGGKVGFKALSDKVAKYYSNKSVPSKYQSLYGKKYDKSEAKEVGDKVAAKVYRQQQAKKK